uniref:Apple domain-containing protein n=1 Tax=Meloidogyne incognita TaxID=6306 RepID=A0A914N9I9_MELIC
MCCPYRKWGRTKKCLCRSVVYDHLQHSCRLYSHDGKEVPAILHPANGFDLYRRTASTQECAGLVNLRKINTGCGKFCATFIFAITFFKVNENC